MEVIANPYWTDEEVISAVLDKGESQQFGMLYDRYNQKVFQKCCSFTSDKSQAEDLLHDIFLKAFLNLSTFKRQSSFSTWLYSIAYRTCVDFARGIQKAELKELEESQYVDIEITDDVDVLCRYLLEAKCDRLQSALLKMDVNERGILMMKYADGMSIKAIAEHLELGESATKMRVNRAKKKLKFHYQEIFFSDDTESI